MCASAGLPETAPRHATPVDLGCLHDDDDDHDDDDCDDHDDRTDDFDPPASAGEGWKADQIWEAGFEAGLETGAADGGGGGSSRQRDQITLMETGLPLVIF